MIHTLLRFCFTRCRPLTVYVFTGIRLVVGGLILLNLLLLKIYHSLLVLAFISLGIGMGLSGFACQFKTTISLLLRWNEILIWKNSLVILTCLLVTIVLGIHRINGDARFTLFAYDCIALTGKSRLMYILGLNLWLLNCTTRLPFF